MLPLSSCCHLLAHLLRCGSYFCRPALVKGYMQLYSVEQKRSQALEAHAAAFSTIKASCCSCTQAAADCRAHHVHFLRIACELQRLSQLQIVTS